MNGVELVSVAGGVLIPVQAHPGAKRTRVVGPHGGMLRVEVSAPADGGKANRAIEELLAEALGVKKRQVALRSGPASRKKVFAVEGLGMAEAQARLDELVGPSSTGE